MTIVDVVDTNGAYFKSGQPKPELRGCRATTPQGGGCGDGMEGSRGRLP